MPLVTSGRAFGAATAAGDTSIIAAPARRAASAIAVVIAGAGSAVHAITTSACDGEASARAAATTAQTARARPITGRLYVNALCSTHVRVLGRYELVRPLARGGMAEVYLARRRV